MNSFKKLSAFSVAAGLSFVLSGCGLLTPPEPEEVPPPPKMPAPDFFNPNDYNTKGVDLNIPGDAKYPDYFEVTSFDAPDVLMVRSVKVTKTGTAPNERETKAYGAPVRMRLAGVYSPRPNSSNAAERRYSPMAMQAVRNWTLGRQISIEQDRRYPQDLQGIPRVQMFFMGGKNRDQKLNLNRMLIRSGYAVVDIHAPTIFDTKGWLNDEEYAREHRLGLWQYIVLQSRQQPPIKTTTTTTTTTPAAAPAPADPAAPPVP